MQLKVCLQAAATAIVMSFGTVAAEAGSEPFLGEIMMVGYNHCPVYWAEANGQLLPISQYSTLFSLFGTIYGGDGRTTFALPDLRGRVPMHSGTGLGLSSRREGERGGGEPANGAANQESNASGGQSMKDFPPYLVIRFCVSLQGAYPSRS